MALGSYQPKKNEEEGEVAQGVWEYFGKVYMFPKDVFDALCGDDGCFPMKASGQKVTFS